MIVHDPILASTSGTPNADVERRTHAYFGIAMV